MSELIKHECGIAMIRLRKPLEYYKEKYGTWQYGLNKLYLLMEKQHNRGQDGAGVVNVKMNLEPGKDYICRHRSIEQNPIKFVFDKVAKGIKKAEKNKPEGADLRWVYENVPFSGEAYLGHLRYGTFGRNSIEFVHPVMRQNNWKSRTLVLAGNFNLTNTDELFRKLIALGQHPKAFSDTVTVLEKVGHFLDEENQLHFRNYKNEGYSNKDISPLIEKNLDVQKVLENSSKDWDGGYTIAGMFGPGDALIIKKDVSVSNKMIRVPHTRRSCSFERIYFSRGSDKDIYQERKMLGSLLSPAILKSINYDIENTVFSFIPNTSETAFYGLVQGARQSCGYWKIKEMKARNGSLTNEDLETILSVEPRVEKLAIKDVKLRTFIADDASRDDLVAHVYDVTYGIIKEGTDTLVIIDDSIVRGTTLKKSILKILDRLNPKKIIVVSSAPQIRYPDCYGIDMAVLEKFIAFNAAIELLKDTKQEHVIDDVYRKCKEQENLPKEEIVNYVKEIYKLFKAEEVSAKIAELLKPDDCGAEVEIIYQTIENLHVACPNDTGDWYFTGNYPTPGGNKVVNTSFINYMEGKG